MNQQLLIALAHALAANETTQRKFRNAVVVALSKIETLVTDIQAAQLVEFWKLGQGQVSDEQRDKLMQGVNERVSRNSAELGLKMVKYIYDEAGESSLRHDRRRRWSNLEI